MKNNEEGERGTPGGWRGEERFWEKMERLRRIQFGRRGFLRPQIIQLFEQGPMNGVDIMNKLQEMSQGWYRPSPGSIYPLLEQLEREGVITKNEEGKFVLTPSYSARVGVGDDVANALSEMESNASYLEDLRRADLARLSKSRDRVERLARRLADLNGALQSTGSRLDSK